MVKNKATVSADSYEALLNSELVAESKVWGFVHKLAERSYKSKWDQLRDLDLLSEATKRWREVATEISESRLER